MSDFKGAALMFGAKGYDADWFRQALKARGIEPCIPPTSNRKTEIPFDKTLYKSRHKIENMFGRLKGWRRLHTRYDRCAHAFMSATQSQQPSSSGSINES